MTSRFQIGRLPDLKKVYTRGLSDQLLGAADFGGCIPMRGTCDSINAAVAAGLLLFEMSGQRREAAEAMLQPLRR